MIAILILFSIISWAIIIQRSAILRQALKSSASFEDRFWSGEDLNKLYEGMDNRREALVVVNKFSMSALKNFYACNKRLQVRRSRLFKEPVVQ